jgi:hypothetical protein
VLAEEVGILRGCCVFWSEQQISNEQEALEGAVVV